MTRSPARLRLGATAVTAAVAASLAVGSGATAHGATTTASRDGGELKTRAANAVLASSTPSGEGDATGATPSAKARSTARGEAPPSDQPSTAPTEPAPRSAAAASATDCQALGLDWTPTNDHVWVHWDSTGASSYAVWRLRQNGTWRQVGTSSTTSFLDKGVNPDAYFTYRVVAGGLTCDLGDWVTMSTADGRGEVDVVYGGAGDASGVGQLMEQDLYSYAMPVGLAGVDPAYSPDGRRIASAMLNAGNLWNLSITDPARPGGYVGGIGMPAGFMGLEPAWSPDGRTLVYTRYAINDQNEVSSPELRLLDVTTGNERAVPGSQGLVQADWRSTATLVAAGFAEGEGLFTIAAAGGTKTPIADTQNAGYPEVAPDGRVWFIEDDGSTARVRAVVPQANDQVGTVHESTTHWFERVRIAPDGTVFVVDIDGQNPQNPDDNTFTVIHGVFGPDGMTPTAIGAVKDQALAGFHGFDVRQPKTKGTSDLLGDANGDILARDASGVLWAYPSSAEKFVEPRVKVGAGWNIYVSMITAGDLNGDNRGDVVAKDKSGQLWFYAGRGNGRLANRVLIGSGWGGLSYLSPGDLNGDGRADLAAVTSGGSLYLYAGKGTGTGFTRTLLGTGFSGKTVIGIGDFNYDNTADLLSREASTGRLYLNAGLGGGKFAARKVVGTGWSGFTGFGTPEFNGGTGIYARGSSGAMRFYLSVGDGAFASGYSAVDGNWKAYAFSS